MGSVLLAAEGGIEDASEEIGSEGCYEGTEKIEERKKEEQEDSERLSNAAEFPTDDSGTWPEKQA